ncbi:MAG: leucine-rich repeat domain-containing protein [Verrucomicrobia bacterium]|nr:leucine-rich repeat domain-containing protein [Verrucomicrobiota bacterium]
MPSQLSPITPFFPIGPVEGALIEKNSPTKVLPVEESPPHAEPSSIDVLPNEVFERIFAFATRGGEDAYELSKLRKVSVKWKDLVDNSLLTSKLWSRLQNGFGPGSHLNAYVEQTCRSSESATDSYFSHFKALTRAVIPGHDGIIGMNADAYERALNTIALEKIWPRIQEQIDFGEDPVPCTASAIRAWLNDPANKEKIASIKKLDLSGMDLKVLPPEIRYLTKLKTLDLTNNQLQVLPPEIGHLYSLKFLILTNNQLQTLPPEINDLDELQGLFLSNNQLQVLPPEIGYLVSLRHLDLSNNQLQVLPLEIGDVYDLQFLNLSNNQLQVLPSKIGKLTKLQFLNLSNNELRVLPPKIGYLERVLMFDLSNNQLQAIPPEIGNMGFLFELRLSNNRLRVLPREIGALAYLRDLDLSNNQLQVLPLQMRALTGLHLYLGGNPLLLALDKDLKAISGKQYVEKYQANANFPCATPFASLCQAIHLVKDDAALLEHFSKLSDEMKKRIIEKLQPDSPSPSFSSSSPDNPMLELLSDRALFARAVIEAASEKINGLDPAKRRETYWQVWDLAGRPVGDDNWGENHAFDNIIRLIEAMEFATRD